jgi:hypothetical protein
MVRSPLRYIARKRFLSIFFNPVLFGLPCWKNGTPAHFRVDSQTVEESARWFRSASFSTSHYKTESTVLVLDCRQKSKLVHFIRITHRDEVEAPVTDWLREAYDLSDAPPKTGQLTPKSRTEKNAPGGKRENRQMASDASRSKAGPAPKLGRGKELDRVRRICSSIRGTIEKISHGEPTFFTPKRVFAMFANNHHGDGRVAVWLPASAGVQTALIAEAPEIYFRPPYVGVSGWVGVEVSKVDDEQLGALIREAFHFIDLKSEASRRPPKV